MAKKQLKLKICGMRNPQNIQGVLDVGIFDFMGFIFYAKSPRYVGELIRNISSNISKVGVFVDEDINVLEKLCVANDLQYVQLHGNESVEYCSALKKRNIGVIKAFRVKTDGDLKDINRYKDVTDYFLFDTKSSVYGGSGKSFDWSILFNRDIPVPFFISGGINLDNIEELLKLELNNFVGIDINSGFEESPGNKELDKIKKLKTLISTL